MSRGVTLQVGLEPFPGYRLRRLLGRGGFAEVWEAQAPDGSAVALKFLPCGDSWATAKEIRAIQAIRRLTHPGLTRIFQVWCHLGYIVVAMELADGSLLDLMHAHQSEMDAPLALEHVCWYLAQAAEVIDFLNARQHEVEDQLTGFQHCDVKPSNLLLFGHTVKVADFGLSSPTTAVLRQHRRAGTLDYAPPEVFQGRLSDRTDQYALAVTYCVLRGGRLPFTNTPQTFRRDYVRPAPDLTMLAEEERPIIARALDPVPQNRWPSCRELIAQLPLAILTPGPLPENLSGPASATVADVDKPTPNDQAAGRPPEIAPSVLARMKAKSPNESSLRVRASNPPPPAPGDSATPPPEASPARSAVRGPVITPQAPRGDKKPLAPGSSPTVPRPAGTAAPKSSGFIPRPPAGSVRPAGSGPIRFAAKSTARPKAAAAEPDAVIMPAQKIAVLKGQKGKVLALAFSPDRHYLVVASAAMTMRLYDFTTSKPRELPIPQSNPGEVHALVFTPDSRGLATGSAARGGLVTVLDQGGGGMRERAFLTGHKFVVEALAFAADGRLLASGSKDKTVRLWEPAAGSTAQPRAQFRGHTDTVGAVALAAAGDVLASAGDDRTVRLWDAATADPQEKAILTGHTDAVHSLAFAPDGRALVSAGQDRTARLWDLSGPRPVERTVFREHRSPVRLVQFLPNGQTVLSVCEGGQGLFWDAATGGLVCGYQLTQVMISSLACTIDGRYLAVGNNDGTVIVFRLGEKRG